MSRRLAYDADVVVVGLGPTGATAANLLAARGLRILVVEREMAIYPRQRAIAIDEDALRIWQGIGLLEPLITHMSTQVTLHFHHRDRIFLSCDLRGGGRQGLPGMCFFHQPQVEQVLRDGLARWAQRVELRDGHELVSMEQDEHGVTAGIRASGAGGAAAVRRVRARYLLGCDGGSSTTRKLLGIALSGRSIAEPWIDIQARARVPHDASGHLDFNYIADPERPGVDCYASMGQHRWEFRLHRDEDPDAAQTPDGLRALLASRGVDADQIEILRSWAYVFHVRQADRWQRGRAFLCGDAAHIMPPFAGQGVSSGVRDVGNLCWKLAAVVHGAPASLLDSYERERRPNVAALTRLSLRIGALVMVQSPFLAVCRNIACRVAVRLPWLGSRIRDFRIKPDWVCGPGLLAATRSWRSPAGLLLWQPWVVPASGYRRRLDDLLGPGWAYLSWRRPNMPAHLREAGVRGLVAHEAGRSWRGLADDEFIDIEGRLRAQFRRHRARGMLIRPDRFIYGSDRDDLVLGLPAAALRPPDSRVRASSKQQARA